MIRKTLTHSANGSLSGGVNYVLSNTNSKNEPRPVPPKIIHGDKDALLEIESEMTQKHTYVHSVLSFTTEEAKALTDDDKQAIAQSYIKQLSAGLPSHERLAVLAVDHGDDIHFLCLRKDLESDKTYQPYVQARGDAHRMELWNEAMQEQHKALIDPNSIELIKLTRTGKAHKNEHESKSTLREQVLDDISARFSQKEFLNRNNIVDYLKNRDDLNVTRVTAKSISISSTVNSSMQNIRLKGALFEKDWNKIDDNFKPKRTKEKTVNATEKLHKINFELHKKAVEKYSENDVDNGIKLHKSLQENNSLFNDIALRNNTLNELKERIDKDDNNGNGNGNNEITLEERINNISFKEAIDAAKSYDADNVSDDELIKVTAFIEKHSDFIEKYDDYMEHRLDNVDVDNIEEYEVSEQELEQDYEYIEMYNEVKAARTNVIFQETKRETNQGTSIKENVTKESGGGSNGGGGRIGGIGGDLGKKMVALYAKMSGEMQSIQRERDNILKQESKGFDSFNKKMNAPAPRPSPKPSPSKGKKKGKRKKK